ncbi:Poly(A) RNA polymerase, mitochondrial [Hypsibius exemplaris]|uniref:Poly(A) RNA polymerase, mitochondrial n=1 Tax=Hypsibius exemplaris TaxID=2072580 RepID=A0A1W0WDQ7_HYPEX|nr:Poly(A) RNA polymerase, mitochondrial [Hypsibius exemplaris]
MWTVRFDSPVRICWRTGMRKFVHPSLRHCSHFPAAPTNSRNYSSNAASTDRMATRDAGKERNFMEEQNFRRAQAFRSVLVQVPSAQFAGALQQQCQEFGLVKSMFHYRQHDKDFILTEMESRDAVSGLVTAGGHQKRDDIVPVRTRLLDGSGLKRSKPVTGDLLLVEDCFSPLENIDNELRGLTDISAQMDALYQRAKLPELGCRLRYFISSQIEDAISGVFPCNRVYLFGSSVNGFGHQNSDVDLILDFDVAHTDKIVSDSSLRFAAKCAAGNERVQTQRSLELLADHLQYLLPGYSNVQRILLARVPIVKFNHEVSGTQCDLSITNMTGLIMSDYLFTLGQIDERLRALVVTIRRWAKAQRLTNPHPGRWITNFTLTIMAVFFMQQRHLLPPLNQLKRDLPRHEPAGNGFDDEMKTLLVEFFEFYSSFDFKRQAISVIEGVAYPKPDFGSLFIENPVETNLNICKNLSADELDRVVVSIRTAVWSLQGSPDSSSDGGPGILKLFTEFGKEHKVSAQRPQDATIVSGYFDGSQRDSSPSRKYMPDQVVVQMSTANDLRKKDLYSPLTVPCFMEVNSGGTTTMSAAFTPVDHQQTLTAREYEILQRNHLRYVTCRTKAQVPGIAIFVCSFFTTMGIQQKVLMKHLPYPMTHRYFLVAPLIVAVTSRQIFLDRRRAKLRHEFFLSQGYVNYTANDNLFHPVYTRARIQQNCGFHFAIASAPRNFKARRTIRRTLKRLLQTNSSACSKFASLLFYVGKTSDETTATWLEREFRENPDDMALVDFCDAYENLPIKTYNMMRFIDKKYPNSTKFVVKMDDDVMPNVHLFSRCFPAMAVDPSFGIFGWVSVDNVADAKGKYAIIPGRYTNATFPAFTHGPAYAVRRSDLPRLLRAAVTTPVLNLEDVWWTGMVAESAGVGRKNATRFLQMYSHRTPKDFDIDTEKTMERAFFFHRITGTTFARVYSKYRKNCDASPSDAALCKPHSENQ